MPLSLTVLGTASPHPGPGRPCSGYLLRGAGAEVWVDAGPGTFAELQRHTDPDRLTAIWISHLHADHSADLLAAAYALAYGGMTPPPRSRSTRRSTAPGVSRASSAGRTCAS